MKYDKKRPSCTSAEFNSLVTNTKSKRRQYLTAFTANLIAFAFGTVNGWTSPAQSKLQSSNSPIGDKPFTDEEISWLGSIVFMGGVLGSLAWSQIADKYGRKVAGYLSALPFVVSWTMMIFAKDYYAMLIARFLVGIGCTGALINVPLIVSEMADKDLRGPLGSCLVIFLNGGYLFSYVIGAFATFEQMNVCCSVIPVVFLVLFYWIPESPTYLINQDRLEEAKDCLLWFRGDDEEVTEIEMRFVLSQYDCNQTSVTVSSLFADRGIFKGFTIGFILIMGQQLTGANFVLTYTAAIFRGAGSKLEPNICTIVIGSLQFMAACLSCMVVNKAGRKVLLLLTYFGIALGLIVMGICYSLINMGKDISSYSYIPIIALSFYVSCNAMGGPVPYILFGEILPAYLQNLAISIAFFFGIFGAFLTVKTYPTLNAIWGTHGTFFFYAICSLTIFVYTLMSVPETKGRSTRAIQRELKGVDPTSTTKTVVDDTSPNSSTFDVTMTKSTIAFVNYS